MRTAIVLLGFAGIALLAGECGVQAASTKRLNLLHKQAHKLMTFEQFKDRFGKVYESELEAARRMMVFVGHFGETFNSVVDFMTGKSSYFKAINRMSDWFDEEIEKLLMKVRPSSSRRTASRKHAEVLEVQPAELERSERSRGLANEPAGGEQRKRLANTGGLVRPDFDIKLAFDRRTVIEPKRQSCAGKLWSRMSSFVHKHGRAESSKARSGDAAADEPEPAPAEETEPAPAEETEPAPADKRAPLQDYTHDPDYRDIVIENGTSTVKHSYDKLPNKKKHIPGDEALPDVVWLDHRDFGCFTPVNVTQDACGACYAFTAATYMQWLHCNHTREMLVFSPQYIVDCGPMFSDGLYGCDGGYPEDAAAFIENFGLELAANYPYLDRDGKCPYSPDTPIKKLGAMKANVMEILFIDTEYMEDYLKKIPLIVDINVDNDFHKYGGGVYEGEKCTEVVRHELILVGHGRLDGEEYWILRNSWGDDWGESGYIRMNKNCICIREAYMYNYKHKPVEVHHNPDVAKKITPADVCPVKKA
jgi:hypothetical protein